MTFGQFTELGLLAPHLPGGGQDGALGELSGRLESCGRIRNAAGCLAAALAREVQLPTVVGEGVVVPHVRSGDVLTLSVAVGLSREGVPWGRQGAAHVIFFFAVPPAEAGRYLSLLSGLSGLMTDEAAFAALRTASHPEEMWRVLNEVPLPG